MTEIIFAIFVVTVVLFALAVTTTLGYLAAALQRVQAEIHTVDLETGTVTTTPLINPIFPASGIPLSKFPPQESYRKPCDEPKPSYPINSSFPPKPESTGTASTVIGSSIFT